jgi:hypothetical protein
VSVPAPKDTENPLVRHLESLTPEEAARLDEAAELDAEGPPPGADGIDDDE